MPSPASQSRARVLLAAGLLLGVGLTAFGLLHDSETRTGLGPATIARVNGVAIPRELFLRTLALVERDRRSPLTLADARHVLERLIDEELLLQRGLEIGLAESDRGVRKAIVGSMIDSIVLESGEGEPEPDELRRFYEENRGYFTPPDRLHVRRLYVPLGKEPERARAQIDQARRALGAGAAFADVRARFGETPVPEVPDGPLPFHKLGEYLGPTLLVAAERLEPGAISEPIEASGGLHLLELVSRADPETTYEAIAGQVEAEYRRRADERALSDYLARLRSSGAVEIALDAPPADP